MTRGIGLHDEDLRQALAPYREVEASERLRHAVAHPGARFRRSSARSRLVVGGVAAGLAAVLTVLLLITRDSSPSADVEAADLPLDVSRAREVMLADDLTVGLDELFDASEHDRLEALFREHGMELAIVEVPVNPDADGRVFSVTVTSGVAEHLPSGGYRLEPGARLEVAVGRADEAAGTAGLTLFEVFPEVEVAVDRDDPVATGQALEALGFQVRWVLIEGPGDGHDVEAPPSGTVVISVLGPEGQWTDIDPAIDTLMVEIATPEVAAELGH